MSQHKLTVVGKALNAVAKAAGYSVVPTTRLNGVEPYFKFFGNAVVYGNWDNNKYISDGYTKNATLYSIVNRITSVSAQAAETFQVYRVKDRAKAAKYKAFTGERATKESVLQALRLKEDAYEVDDKHPFNNLLNKPNEWQGMNEFLQTSIGFKLLTGNRYLFLLSPDIGANAGIPVALYNLPPQIVSIVRGEGMWTVAGYNLTLTEEKYIPKELIVHSRYWNPNFDLQGSHLYGMSPVEAAARRLDIARQAEDRSNAMMRNAGGAGVMFNKTIASWTPEQAAEMKRKVNEDILGKENASTIGIANGDLGFIQFGMKAADLEIIEQEKYTDQKLANIYKVPPGLFDSNANATDNNIAAWNRQLVTQACLPALADVRDDLNTILARYGDTGEYYVDYDVNIFPEMQEDQGKLAEILNKSWYLTPNEKRIIRGYDEDMEEEMMNRYLVPNNIVDISTLNPETINAQMESVDEELARQTNNDGESEENQ